MGKLGSCAGADALGKFPAENAAAPFSKYSFKWLYSNPYHIEQYVTNGPTYVIGRLLRYQLPNPNQYDLKDHFLLACDWSFRISCIGSVGHGDKKLPKSYSVGYELKYTCSNPTLFLECKKCLHQQRLITQSYLQVYNIAFCLSQKKIQSTVKDT